MKLGTIPPNASLCGAKACIQFGIKCAKGGFGLTNALEISLGG